MTGTTRGTRMGLAAVVGATLALAAAAWVVATPPKIATTLTITADPATVLVGEPTTITFKVTPVPNGGYVWPGAAVGQLPVDPVTGIATHEFTFPHAGRYTIDALYSGTDAYLGTSYVDGYATVLQRQVTATYDGPDAAIGRGDPFDVVVTLDPAPDGGRVQLQGQTGDGGWSAFKWEDVTGGQTTIHVDSMDPGSYTLRAMFQGTDAYATATTDPVTLEVFDRPTTTVVETSPNPSSWGEAVTVQVTVRPIPDDGGRVSLWLDGRQNAWVPMDWATGTGSVSIELGDPGDYTIRAEYHAAAYYPRWGESADSITQTVSSEALDTDAPVGTITIDHGNAVAPEGYCVLTLAVTEAHPGRAEISGDGVTWVRATLWEGDFGWSLNDPAVGGFGEEGIHTIYARWTDWFGNVSDVASDSITLDYMPPTGTVYLPDGSYYYVWPDLTVDVTASDLGSDVDIVRLSNDGAAWTEMPYQPRVQWTVTPGDGEKTIHVMWRDGGGHWSEPKTQTLWIDTVQPVTTGPVPRPFLAGVELASGRAPVQLGWSGSDAGGIARYELSRSTDGGTWSSPVQASTAKASVSLAPGHAYRFRVRAVDKAGHTGAWTAGTMFKVVGVQQSSSAVRWRGSWRTRTQTAAWGGSFRTSATAGSTASVTLTGTTIAWVARTGPNRGVATVYVDGVKVATVDLRSTKLRERQLVWSKSWTTAKARSIMIKVRSSAARPYVDVDGFLVIR